MKSTDLRDMFREFKVLTLKQVALKHECSIRTVQRKSARLPVLRSYNKNSRYYTLSDIPDFNNNGIWRYRDIFFSVNGNLWKTVKNLILASERGLNGNEIGEIVNLSPRSFMHHFREMGCVFREKHEGVYVYFSDDPATYSEQCSKRVHAGVMRKIGDAVVVKISVEYIRHPEMSSGELSIVLRDRRCCNVSASEIQNLLAFHDLLKKLEIRSDKGAFGFMQKTK